LDLLIVCSNLLGGDIQISLHTSQIGVKFWTGTTSAEITALNSRFATNVYQVTETDSVLILAIPQHDVVEEMMNAYISEPIVQFVSPVYFRPDLRDHPRMTYADKMIVRLKKGASENVLDELNKKHKVEMKYQFEFRQIKIIVLLALSPFSKDIEELCQVYLQNQSVEYAGPNWKMLDYLLGGGVIPHDPYFHSDANSDGFTDQWNLHQVSPNPDCDIDAPEAWAISIGNSPVKIGIMDTGIDYIQEGSTRLVHPDFRCAELGLTKLVPESEWFNALPDTPNNEPLEINPHGTSMAGIAAAAVNNKNDQGEYEGTAGIGWSWAIKILPMKVTDNKPEEEDILQCLDWAIQHDVDVINMSWQYVGEQSNIDLALQTAYEDHGIFLAACSHNQGVESITYPASNPYVVAVGGSAVDDSRWSYSNYGEGLEVVAPAGISPSPINIYAPKKHFIYWNSGATSGATAQVSGLAALLKSFDSSLSNVEIREIISKSAEQVRTDLYDYNVQKEYGAWNIEMGYGRINAYQALLMALSYNEYDISGTVSYYTEPPLVNDAILELINYNGRFYDTTDESGYYIFEDVNGGEANLEPSKEGDQRSGIMGSDVLLLLQYLAFLATLTEDQKFAADVTEDGNVTGSDAQAILAYLAFLPDHASTGEWRFDPSDTSFILTENTIIDFKAFLLGDVNGDWAEPRSKSDSLGTIADVVLDFDTPITNQDGFIEVPVTVTNVKEPLYTFILNISYDSKYLTYQETNKTNLTEKFEMVANGKDSAIVHIAMAGIKGVEKDGEILRLVFKGNRSNISETDMALEITRAIINDYEIINDNNGQIGLPKQQAEAEIISIPEQFCLHSNYPNPFNPTTAIKYALPIDKNNYFVTLKIYDALGRLVKTLVELNQASGSYQVIWDGRDMNGRTVTSGIYFYTIQAGDFRMTKKMVLIR